MRASGGMGRRLAVSVAAAGVYAAARYVPLPRLEQDLFVGYDGSPALSWRALGLLPLLYTFLVVEVVRVLRQGDPERRRAGLTFAAWALGLLVAALQARGIAAYLETLPTPGGFAALEPDGASALLLGGALVAGVALSGGLAAIVTRHGIGNGFAILLGVEALERLAWASRDLLLEPRSEFTDASLVVGLALAVVVPLAVRRRGRDAGGPRLPVPSCGLAPVLLPERLLAVPAALASFLPGVRDLFRSDLVYGALAVVLAGALALVLSRLFCPPAAVLEAFRAGPDGDADVRAALAHATRSSLLLVVALAATPYVFMALGLQRVITWAELVSAVVVVAVAADLGAEVRFRSAHGPLSTAGRLQRVYAVEPALARLAAAGVPAHPRALRFRTLWHFFAPFTPVELLVPAEHGAKAAGLCAPR